MNAKSLALISGKGGSGKTTLGLSLASLLSRCNIKVLLVDCDLSTNGATYFYEKKLSEVKESITCFSDIIYNDNCSNIKCLNINQYYDFLPSIITITSKQKISMCISSNIDAFFKQVSSKYDVIIFDCQAGYSDVLKNLLPIIELNLAVMEADAISSSAMRSLYLKIGKLLNDRKIYQVFNKATSEEYEIYSKLYGGTIFTNIETVMFDWKIRKAFSVAQIPDMENTSANYGMQLLNISNILFPETSIQNKLKKFSTILEINKHYEEIKLLKEKISDINEKKEKQKKNFLRKAYTTIIPMMSMMLVIIYSISFLEELSDNNMMNVFLLSLIVGICAVSMLFSFFIVFDLRGEQKDLYTKLSAYRNELENHMKAKEELKNELDSIKKSRSKSKLPKSK